MHLRKIPHSFVHQLLSATQQVLEGPEVYTKSALWAVVTEQSIQEPACSDHSPSKTRQTMLTAFFSKGCFLVPGSLVPILNTFIRNYFSEGTKQLPSKQQIPSPHPEWNTPV